MNINMKKYKVHQYDHFFRTGHDYKGTWFFNTMEEAEKFIQQTEESKKKWPDIFGKFEYVLEIKE